jgi:hypothetical protein
VTAWYIDRSAGLVAWVLLSASTIFGLLLSSKLLGRKVRPNWLLDLHRGLSGLSVIFVGVHVAGAIGDNYIHFGLAEVLVPFASGWRAGAVAWGVVSLYLLAAVEISSLLRKHLSKTAWRRLHFLSFPLFVSATAHGITAGTELGTRYGIMAAATVIAAVGALTALRVVDETERPRNSDGTPRPARVPARPAAGLPARTATPVAPAAPVRTIRSTVARRGTGSSF